MPSRSCSVLAAIAASNTNGADGSFVSGVNEWWPMKPAVNPADSTCRAYSYGLAERVTLGLVLVRGEAELRCEGGPMALRHGPTLCNRPGLRTPPEVARIRTLSPAGRRGKIGPRGDLPGLGAAVAYPHLFQPIDVGPITIPNRIVRSAHGTLLTGERLIAYHEARAAGGVGMSTLEATGVHANAPSVLPLHSDDVIPIYRELMDRIRPYGMKMLQQIYHPGSATRPKKAATQVSSSPIPNPMVGGIPIEMTHPMIAEMVEAFASAARRCREGGLDGVDVHASSGYLIEQFLSPANNTRDGRVRRARSRTGCGS